MIDCGSLEYAQARVAARHGRRPGATDWQALETPRELTALLQAASRSPLRAWVAGLTAQSSAHEIEQMLRGRWDAQVDELVGWMPPGLHGALQWCKPLPRLPALAHLAAGGAPTRWMPHDPWLRPLCTPPPAARAAALHTFGLGALAPVWSNPVNLPGAWQREWQRRLPATALRPGSGLQALQSTLQAHASDAARALPGSAPGRRAALDTALQRLLRRVTGEPALAFVHLALCALDLQRLRSELLRRALFARPTEVP